MQFGKKTLTIPAVDLLSASGKDVDKKNKTFKVFEKGSINKEKVFDVATKFSVDQMISLKLIIDAVLENQGA